MMGNFEAISHSMRVVLKALAQRGGTALRRELRAETGAADSTLHGLIRRGLIAGISGGRPDNRYPYVVQLTAHGIEQCPRYATAALVFAMPDAVWDEARYEHEQRHPKPRSYRTEIKVVGDLGPIVIRNFGGRVGVGFANTRSITLGDAEIQQLIGALTVAQAAARTHRKAG